MTFVAFLIGLSIGGTAVFAFLTHRIIDLEDANAALRGTNHALMLRLEAVEDVEPARPSLPVNRIKAYFGD